VRALLSIESTEDKSAGAQIQPESSESTAKWPTKNFKLVVQEPLDKLYAKVRELVR